MKQLGESIRVGKFGDGSLRRFVNSSCWVYCFRHNGQEHRESTGTSDLREAKRYPKRRLDERAADRQGLRAFIAPTTRQVTIADLLDEWKADVELRGLKSARKLRQRPTLCWRQAGPFVYTAIL